MTACRICPAPRMRACEPYTIIGDEADWRSTGCFCIKHEAAFHKARISRYADMRLAQAVNAFVLEATK